MINVMKPNVRSGRGSASQDRTADLIRFFVSRLSGHIGRTRIVKLLYLADLESRRYLGKPMTRLKYRLDHHGPFDPRILQTLDDLEGAGEIQMETRPVSAGTIKSYHAKNLSGPSPFTPAEESVLAFVFQTYSAKNLADLLEDVVYETAPMKKVKGKDRKTLLPMEIVDNEARLDLGGIHIENALLGEEQIRNGDTVRWEDLKGELRNRSVQNRRR